jgi:hypothetical protein
MNEVPASLAFFRVASAVWCGLLPREALSLASAAMNMVRDTSIRVESLMQPGAAEGLAGFGVSGLMAST